MGFNSGFKGLSCWANFVQLPNDSKNDILYENEMWKAMWNLRFWKLWLSRVASPSGFFPSGLTKFARLHGCTCPPTSLHFNSSANGINCEDPHLCSFPHPYIISPFLCTNILLSIFALRPSTYLPFGLRPSSSTFTKKAQRRSNPDGSEIFRTCPDRPWGPPSLL
jgi:hypothetical protein